jgi:hypothetical protein
MAEKQLLTEIDAAVRELRSFLIIFAKSDILPQGPTNFYANFKTFEGLIYFGLNFTLLFKVRVLVLN